ncbi:DNA polymerase III subunit gamma and tau, partial [Streptomyces zhihengii]
MTGNDSITSTTAQLEEELPRLEALQHALRGELEQVTVRLESVRGALTALGALAAAPLPRPRAEPSAPAAPAESAAADAVTPTPAAPAAPAPEAAAADEAPAPETPASEAPAGDAEAPAEAPEAAS